MNIQAESNLLSRKLLSAAMEVHTQLGPGLLESAYEDCLCQELVLRGIPFQRQVPLPLEYKGIQLGSSYKIDILLGGLVVVELKTVEALAPIHQAQLLTYLKLSGHWLGILINFNSVHLRDGIKRFVNGYQ